MHIYITTAKAKPQNLYKRGTRLVYKIGKDDSYLATVTSFRNGKMYLTLDNGNKLQVAPKTKKVLGFGVKDLLARPLIDKEVNNYLVSQDNLASKPIRTIKLVNVNKNNKVSLDRKNKFVTDIGMASILCTSDLIKEYKRDNTKVLTTFTARYNKSNGTIGISLENSVLKGADDYIVAFNSRIIKKNKFNKDTFKNAVNGLLTTQYTDKHGLISSQNLNWFFGSVKQTGFSANIIDQVASLIKVDISKTTKITDPKYPVQGKLIGKLESATEALHIYKQVQHGFNTIYVKYGSFERKPIKWDYTYKIIHPFLVKDITNITNLIVSSSGLDKRSFQWSGSNAKGLNVANVKQYIL